MNFARARYEVLEYYIDKLMGNTHDLSSGYYFAGAVSLEQ